MLIPSLFEFEMGSNSRRCLIVLIMLMLNFLVLLLIRIQEINVENPKEIGFFCI